jgi:hypothetical protein
MKINDIVVEDTPVQQLQKAQQVKQAQQTPDYSGGQRSVAPSKVTYNMPAQQQAQPQQQAPAQPQQQAQQQQAGDQQQAAAPKRTGGKVAGQVSQTPNAVRKRAARANAKQAPQQGGGAGAFGNMAQQLGNQTSTGGQTQATPQGQIHTANPNNPNQQQAPAQQQQEPQAQQQQPQDQQQQPQAQTQQEPAEKEQPQPLPAAKDKNAQVAKVPGDETGYGNLNMKGYKINNHGKVVRDPGFWQGMKDTAKGFIQQQQGAKVDPDAPTFQGTRSLTNPIGWGKGGYDAPTGDMKQHELGLQTMGNKVANQAKDAIATGNVPVNNTEPDAQPNAEPPAATPKSNSGIAQGMRQATGQPQGPAPAQGQQTAAPKQQPQQQAQPAQQGQQQQGQGQQKAQSPEAQALSKGVRIVNHDPIIISFKNKDFGLDDNGQWIHLASGKIPPESIQSFLSQQHDTSLGIG